MIKVSIIGATGYTGIELIRILKSHPMVSISKLYSESYKENKADEIYPHLKNNLNLNFCEFSKENFEDDCDIIFLALPHGHALNLASFFINQNKKIIDLSADFRIKNTNHFYEWYHKEHTQQELLKNTLYGLPEITNKINYNNINSVANPGCYPTAILLATIPLLKFNLIEMEHCIFDAKSGVSGAGRSLQLNSHFCEINENINAYQIAGKHRHIPEIEEQLNKFTLKNIKIQFTPHLIPVTRGMHITSYFHLKDNVTEKNIYESYVNFYENSSFIRIYKDNILPQIKNVKGTNYCDIGFQIDPRTNKLIVISVIDNLIKGAVGQAIQNMNLMFHLKEDLGLHFITNYP